jgi:hypothetical protein
MHPLKNKHGSDVDDFQMQGFNHQNAICGSGSFKQRDERDSSGAMFLCSLFGDIGIRLDGDSLPTPPVRVLVVDDFEPFRRFVASIL